MNALSLFPFFVAGLVGSVHCVGMCGGIVSAFSMATTRPAFPVTVTTVPAIAALDGGLRVLAYNAGRLGSYMAAGALAGGMLGGVRQLAGAAPLQMVAYWLANLMLVALGLYLMDVWRGLARLEAAPAADQASRPGIGTGGVVGLAAMRHGLQHAADFDADRVGIQRRGRDAGLRSGHHARAGDHGPAWQPPADLDPQA
jgi:hypothetical protein